MSVSSLQGSRFSTFILHRNGPELASPKIGQNGWFITENPIGMDDLGVPPFKETSIRVTSISPALVNVYTWQVSRCWPSFPSTWDPFKTSVFQLPNKDATPCFPGIYIYIPSLKLTPNFTPLKIGQKKRKEIVFQPSIFRCETVSFREGIIYIIQIHIYVYHLEPPNDLMTSIFEGSTSQHPLPKQGPNLGF